MNKTFLGLASFSANESLCELDESLIAEALGHFVKFFNGIIFKGRVASDFSFYFPRKGKKFEKDKNKPESSPGKRGL